MPEPARVLVVGAGPAGLATSQQLQARAVPHRVLERGDSVGHTWANLYDSLTLHTGKHMSNLPDMPFPRSAPLFVPRREFWEYLRHYAQTFELPVDTGCQVEHIGRTDDDGGGWTVHARGGEGGRVLRASVVVVAWLRLGKALALGQIDRRRGAGPAGAPPPRILPAGGDHGHRVRPRGRDRARADRRASGRRRADHGRRALHGWPGGAIRRHH